MLETHVASPDGDLLKSQNFEFLAPKHPELASLGAFAEVYARPDPAEAPEAIIAGSVSSMFANTSMFGGTQIPLLHGIENVTASARTSSNSSKSWGK